jgi:MFS family permease
MQSVTQPYLAYRLSGKPFDLGLIGFASALPTLILALPGGVIVERLDKRNTVIVLQFVMMFQAFLMASLALTGVIQIWHIVVLSFILGTASAIEITARQAMLIELVGKDRLPNAIALQSTIFNAARIIGPSLVAPFLIFIQQNGEGWAFLANGISYLFVIIGLFFVNSPFKTLAATEKRNMIAEFRAGQRYIRATPVVAMIILMAGIVGFIGFPLLQQMPVIARDVLAQTGDTEATRAARNSLLYMSQGIGALIAALTLASVNLKRKGLMLTAGQAVFILSLIAVSFTRIVPLMAGLIILVGWGTVTMLATMNTLIQIEVPDELRGRVFSTYLWGLQGVAPFGSLVIGWMAQQWGVPFTTLVCGLLCLFAIGSIHLANPAIRATQD